MLIEHFGKINSSKNHIFKVTEPLQIFKFFLVLRNLLCMSIYVWGSIIEWPQGGSI